MSVLASLISRSGSIENPATPLSAIFEGSDLHDTLTGGRKSASGIRVSQKVALTYDAWWRGVDLVSEYVGKLPVRLYRREAGGGKTLAREDPRYRLVRHKPNPYMTAKDMKKTVEAHRINRGNGYIYIFRDGAGRPLDLLPLDPTVTFPIRVNGVLWYMTTIDMGNGIELNRKLPARDVIHIKGLGFDGLIGYDVLTYAAETIGMGVGLRKFGAIFFKNGATPNVVIEYPNVLTPAQISKIEQTWKEKGEGLENAYRTRILDKGAKANALAIDARKAQLIDQRAFEVRAVANFIGVPPHKLGDREATSYASLEQENRAFHDDSMDGRLVDWEEAFWDKLLTEEEKEKESLTFEFDRKALLRADTKTETDSLTTELNNGGLTLNEYRAIQNRPALPPEIGDVIRMPSNHTVLKPNVEGDDTGAKEDLAFKRELVKIFATDGTIGDVMFNLLDGKGLLDEVNVKTDPNLAEPWLPVVAAAGELVSGEVNKDSEGDIVGGAVEENNETQKGKNAKTPDVEPGSPVDLDDPAAVRAAFERIVRAARARRSQAQTAAAEAVRDAYARMNRRMAIQASRAAKRPAEFVRWVESIAGEQRAVVTEAVGPAERCLAAIAGKRADVAGRVGRYLEWVAGELLGVAECKPDELPAAVERWAKKI